MTNEATTPSGQPLGISHKPSKSGAMFTKFKAENKPAFIGYLPYGFPNPDVSLDAFKTMVEHGVDAVEIGLPYSDPVMDGPVIQAAASIALNNGETIKRVFEQHGYLLDPHTAVAYQTAENLRGENPVLIASTAHWAKFGDNVYRALHGIEPGAPLPDDVAALSGCKLNELIARETGVDDIPHGLAELDALPIRFDEVIDGGTNDIEAAALRFLEHLDD